MNFSSKIDSEDQLIIIETTGSLTYDIFPKIIGEIIILSEKTNYSKALVNHENATVSPLSGNDLRKIAQDCAMMNKQLKDGKLAVVLVNDIDAGLGNMWWVYTDELLTYQAKYFRSSKDALDWLLNNT